MDQEYKYGFKNDDVSIIKTPKGLNKQVVREISALKNEPDWMLDFRLKALDFFLKSPLPKFGPDLSSLDFNSYTYFIRSTKHVEKSWDEVPDTIKQTFQKLGIPEAEQKYLAGVSTQYESEVVYHNITQDIETGTVDYNQIYNCQLDSLEKNLKGV